MKKNCVTCNFYGKTALCTAYDHRQEIRVNSLLERAAKGYCSTWFNKKERKLARG
jgi:hypothetical protein